ncbi:MAG: EscU/YscU/HrcU family type III secretion system export apparatus switch protein [Candidatus Eremiobacterota bacterium]
MSKHDDLDDYEEFDYIEEIQREEFREEEDKEKVAVVLRFDPEQDSAPRIVAAGKGETAEQIIEVAEQGEIPVYKDGNLARTLSDFEVGAVIPGELYELIAEVLIFLYQLNEEWIKDRAVFEEDEEINGK